MVKELDKMIRLRERFSGEEQVEIDRAIDNIVACFQQMIGQTSDFLIKGKNDGIEVTEVVKSIAVLKHYGDQKGVEFPEVKDEKDAKVYVLKFGKEVLFS